MFFNFPAAPRGRTASVRYRTSTGGGGGGGGGYNIWMVTEIAQQGSGVPLTPLNKVRITSGTKRVRYRYRYCTNALREFGD